MSRTWLGKNLPLLSVVVSVTYTYVVPTRYLAKLAEIKKETSVGIARQISFALDLYLKEYDERPAFRHDLLAYEKGFEKKRKREPNKASS